MDVKHRRYVKSRDHTSHGLGLGHSVGLSLSLSLSLGLGLCLSASLGLGLKSGLSVSKVRTANR